jgi:DNA-binding transcriptional MerR regulator
MKDSFTIKQDELAASQKDEEPNTGAVNVQIFDLQKPLTETMEQPTNIKQETILEGSPLQVSMLNKNQVSVGEEGTNAIADSNYTTTREDPKSIDEKGFGQTSAGTGFEPPLKQTQMEQAFSEIETAQTAVETEENNAENTIAENLPEQIIEIPGSDKVLVAEAVEISKSINEEKRSEKLDDTEIFNDGKIRVKIKQKLPEVAVNEEKKEDAEVAIIEEEEKKEDQQGLIQKRGRKSFKEIDAEVDLIEIPEDEVLFERQYYSISQVAEWFKVNTSLIRFWENEFDILKPKKNRKGDRLFRPEDVKNLQLIYHLLRQRKYTIEGAKEFIKTNKKKADFQLQLTTTLQKVRSFLLDLKANLQ